MKKRMNKYYISGIVIIFLIFIYIFFVNKKKKTEKYHVVKYYSSLISGEDTVYSHFLYLKKTVDANGLRNGETVNYYYKDGYDIANYKDDTLNGYKRMYYENGNLKRLSYYKNGKLDGAEYFYDEKGRIKLYNYYSDSSKCYCAHYDTLGFIDYVSGSPFIKFFLNFAEPLPIDSTFYFGLYLASPPLYIPLVVENILDSNGNGINKPDTIKINKNNEYPYSYKFDNPGRKYWGCEYQLISIINKDSIIKKTFGVSFKAK